ncbi:MAG: hypothetical protein LBL49_05630 [Clostridiales Family XIII bacterium]|jgi:predicted small secreted protein|nr:hypothetical protein [Clostridiales Family XIII bacterium]
MKKSVFLIIILVVSILVLASCREKNTSVGYDETIINDGNYTVQNVDDKKGENYFYPALEALIESIEDPERKQLVRLISHSPTRVEFSSTNEISNDGEDSIRQMYIESFDKTIELIKLPIEDLRSKAESVREDYQKLKDSEGL